MPKILVRHRSVFSAIVVRSPYGHLRGADLEADLVSQGPERVRIQETVRALRRVKVGVVDERLPPDWEREDDRVIAAFARERKYAIPMWPCVCRFPSRSPRKKVTPPTGILGSLVRLALDVLGNHKIRGAKSRDDSIWTVELKVERDLSAKQVVHVDKPLANVKGNECQATRHEDPPHLLEDWREFGHAEVYDGIEHHHSNKTGIIRSHMPHVFHSEFKVGIQALRHRDHIWRNVEPKDADTLLTQISCDMPRPAAEIGDETAATSVFGKPVQEMPVEWFTLELP
jgi:hypothetical protein